MMLLRDIAHSRTGDKGNISNVSVIAFDPKDWDVLVRQVTAERVRAHFGAMITGPVERYELPQISALNFVMHDALAGGVTRSLALDPHGKCLSSLILTLDIDMSAA
ncbi:AtuA-related protein [Thalassospira sp. SM2505]